MQVEPVSKKNGVYRHVEVSRTNYNRFRYGTHSLRKVLQLEGYQVVEKDGVVYVQVNETWTTLSKVDLVQRLKPVERVPAPEVEPTAAGAVA